MKRIILSLLILTSSVIAQNEFLVERIINGGAESVKETNTVIFKVVDKNDKELFTVSKIVDYDIPFPTAKAFDDGSIAIVSSFDASIEFYSNKAQLIKKIYLLGKNNVEYERAVYASTDGNRIALALMDGKESGSEIYVIKNDGEIINEWKIAEDNISGIAYNSERDLILLSVYDHHSNELIKNTACYNFEGTLIASSPMLFDKYRFENNSSFIGFTNKNAFVFNLTELQFEESFTVDSDEILLDAITNRSGIGIIVSDPPKLYNGQWRYSGASLLRINDSIVTSRQKIQLSSDFTDIKLFNDSGKTLVTVNNKIIETE